MSTAKTQFYLYIWVKFEKNSKWLHYVTEPGVGAKVGFFFFLKAEQ